MFHLIRFIRVFGAQKNDHAFLEHDHVVHIRMCVPV